jgi:hypothetical protein
VHEGAATARALPLSVSLNERRGKKNSQQKVFVCLFALSFSRLFCFPLPFFKHTVEKAATALKKDGVVLGAVDATIEKDLGSQVK